tara:strand:+ start:4247 stop:5056 length:810 start_codon:yes stop_codon:yes gene_type:complete
MANTIDQAFVKQFETEVHMAYQRMGSKLRNTVRSSNVSGSQARFQKIGKGTAVIKARQADVVPMDLAHTNVEVTMVDYFAAEYIDKLDELKTNINERQAVATSAASALGRQTDALIIAAMDAGANATAIGATGSVVSKTDLLTLFETMGTADVPEDGQRYLAMSPAAYSDLFLIEEFASSDYVGPQNLPFAGGMTMKEFLGFKIFSTSAVAGGKNFAYHSTAVGIGINADVQTEVNYVAQKVSHLTTSMMSMGAIAIDSDGIYEVLDNN